jgi:hypothetical protein
MVPILSNNVGGSKVSIYTPQINATHPMNAVRLKNDTGLHLAGGPITVYDDGVYAGDAQIENLQPDEERLLSYAVDLAVEGKYEMHATPEQLLSVRADSGVLHITRKSRMEHRYTLRNKDDKPRTVVVEQPIEADWNLVQPATADEKTATHYRFNVQVPAKTTGTLLVVTEHPISESVSLVDADVNLLLNYARNAKLSEKLRNALRDLAQMRRKITDLQAQESAAQEEIAAITAEQARIRENMKTLDKNTPLYQQYVKKLTDQESRIETLRTRIQQLKSSENDARETLRKYLDTLNTE